MNKRSREQAIQSRTPALLRVLRTVGGFAPCSDLSPLCSCAGSLKLELTRFPCFVKTNFRREAAKMDERQFDFQSKWRCIPAYAKRRVLCTRKSRKFSFAKPIEGNFPCWFKCILFSPNFTEFFKKYLLFQSNIKKFLFTYFHQKNT